MGRLLLLQFRGKFAHGITVNSCTNVTVANLTMHNVGMFFVIDWAGHGNQVCLQCPAAPAPQPLTPPPQMKSPPPKSLGRLGFPAIAAHFCV